MSLSVSGVLEGCVTVAQDVLEGLLGPLAQRAKHLLSRPPQLVPKDCLRAQHVAPMQKIKMRISDDA